MATRAECAREVLATNFKSWLENKYSRTALQFVDKNQEARIWVAETGQFVPGTGQCVWERCYRCGQSAKVLGDGNVARVSNEPECLVSDGIVPITELVR